MAATGRHPSVPPLVLLLVLCAALQCGAAGLKDLYGYYYKLTNFSRLVTVRRDTVMTFSWGTGTPSGITGGVNGLVGANGYSVWWTGTLLAQFDEWHNLTLCADGAAALAVDGATLLSNDSVLPQRCLTGAAYLVAQRPYNLTVQYVHFAGVNSGVALWWGGERTGLSLLPAYVCDSTPVIVGTYIGSRHLGTYSYRRRDPILYFPWPNSLPPGPVLGVDLFSVRWVAGIVPDYSELYNITISGDDGVRLRLANTALPVLEDWSVHAVRPTSSSTLLTRGAVYGFLFEYNEVSGGAHAELSWSSPSQPLRSVPSSAFVPPCFDRRTGVYAEFFRANFTGPRLAGTLRPAPLLDPLSLAPFRTCGAVPAAAAASAGAGFTARWRGTLLLAAAAAGGGDGAVVAVALNHTGAAALTLGGRVVLNATAPAGGAPQWSQATVTAAEVGSEPALVVETAQGGGGEPYLELLWNATGPGGGDAFAPVPEEALLALCAADAPTPTTSPTQTPTTTVVPTGTSTPSETPTLTESPTGTATQFAPSLNGAVLAALRGLAAAPACAVLVDPAGREAAASECVLAP